MLPAEVPTKSRSNSGTKQITYMVAGNWAAKFSDPKDCKFHCAANLSPLAEKKSSGLGPLSKV